MVVSKPSVRSPPPAVIVLVCNGQAVEHVDSFKYLGLHFHTPGGILNLIACLEAKAPQSWGVIQQWQSQLQCRNTINLVLSLLHSTLMPALHDGCQLWGIHTPTGEAKTG